MILYDGTATMRGTHSGIATQLPYKEPGAVYMHCCGHAINLACNDYLHQYCKGVS